MTSAQPIPSAREHRRSERGVVMIFVAVAALLIIGLIGLALDGAHVLTAAQKLQQAGDAAALAAARTVKWEAENGGGSFGVTRQAAIDIAAVNEAASESVTLEANFGNQADGDIVVGVWNDQTNTFTPDKVQPNAVRVVARKTGSDGGGPLDLIFGSVFGSPTSDVGAESIAVLEFQPDPLLLVLEPTKPNSLFLNGTNSMTVLGGTVHINSSAGCGLNFVGTPYMSALKTTTVGGACYPDGTIGGPVETGDPAWPDPLAGLLPDDAAWDAFKAGLPTPLGPSGIIDAGGTFQPGYYPDGLDVASTVTVTLNPGYYMFGDGGIDMNGGSQLLGTGVTLFIDEGADVRIAGVDTGLQISAPGPGDAFEGVAVFHHRNNTGKKEAFLGGTGLFNIEGIYYLPGGEVVLAGTPGKEIGAIYASTITTEGTTGFIITGKGVPKNESNDEYAWLVR